MELRTSQKSRYFAWGFGALAVFFALVTLARYTSRGAAEETADLLPSAVVSSDGLTARVTLGTSTLPVGTPVSLWLTVANEGNRPRHGISFQDLRLDGMEAVGPCWERVGRTPSHPICLAQAPTSPAHRWPIELEAKTRVTFWASVEASKSGTPSFAATLVAPAAVDATAVDGGAPVNLRLNGPVVRASRGWFTPDHLHAFLALLGNVGTFALPIVLAVLGYHFSRKSEKERRTHEEVVAEENQRHEVWRQMLPRVHENAQKYYMPVSGAIGALWTCYDELAQGCIAKEKKIKLKERFFYHLIMIFVRMQALRREIGGFYFKNYEGELLASSLWHAFQESCRGDDVGRYIDFQHVVNHLTVEENIATFAARLAKQKTAASPTDPSISSPRWVARLAADLAPLLQRPSVALSDQQAVYDALVRIRDTWFGTWLDREVENQNSLYLLRLLEVILDHEMNVPYRLWYGKAFKDSDMLKDRLAILKSCRPWLQNLDKQISKDGTVFKDLHATVKDYFCEEILSMPKSIPPDKNQPIERLTI